MKLVITGKQISKNTVSDFGKVRKEFRYIFMVLHCNHCPKILEMLQMYIICTPVYVIKLSVSLAKGKKRASYSPCRKWVTFSQKHW